MYQSFHRYKVYKMKSAHFTKTATELQKHAKTYICTFSIPKNMSGCCKLLIFFQVGQRIPRQIIWTYLSLSASTLKMTELTLRTIQSKFCGQFKPNRETNIDKIMLALPTFGGNKWIDTQLILGLFCRGLKSQQFSRMWTDGLRQFSWTVWGEKKIEGKDRKGTTKTHAKTNGPHWQKKWEFKETWTSSSSHACARACACAYACARAYACACVCRCFRQNCSTTSGAFKSSPLSSQCRTVGRRRVLQDLYSRNFVCLCSGGWPDHGIWELVHPLSFVPTTPPQFRTLKWWRHRRS